MTERPDSDVLPRSLEVDLDGAGPAVPISAARRRAMTQEILAAARAEAPRPAEAAVSPRGRRRLRAWVLVAAAMLVCAGAMAAVAAWPTRDEPRPESPSAPVELPQPEVTSPADTEDTAPEVTAPEVTAPEDTSPEVTAPEVTSPEETAPEVTPPRRRSRALQPSPAPTSPEDGLAVANGLRAERRWDAAERAYLAVVGRFPSSEQAYAARLAAADLQLSHTRRPARALASYQAALAARPAGPLAAQARFGIARSLRRLGRTVEERRALEAYLAAHPDDLRASSARARIAELTDGR